MAHKLMPLAVSVPLAGALIGASPPTAYRLHLPVLALPGRQRVAIANLERLLGTKITAEHLAEAQARLDQSHRATKRPRREETGEGSEGPAAAEARDASRE
jgi:hypothetical protein